MKNATTTFDFTISLTNAEGVEVGARYEALRRCANAVFVDAEQAEDVYGTTRQVGPDRDTQGLLVTRRDVRRRFAFEGADVVCTVGEQESFGEDPIEEGKVSAWRFGVSFSNTPWGWAWARMQKILGAVNYLGGQFLDGPHFSGAWIETAEQQGDAAAVEAILALQLAEARKRLCDPRHLDLQRLPRQDLQALLLEVEQPETIKSLGLNNNKLSALPDAVRACTGLQRLKIFNNPIATLPEWLSELTELREINADSSGLGKDALDEILPEGHGVRLTI